MRFDTRIILKDYEGNDITYQVDRNHIITIEPLALREALVKALNELAPNEIQTAEDKSRIFQLSLKLYKDNEVNLTSDEMVFLKERVGKVWNAIVYGRICELFDSETPQEISSHN